MVAATLTLIILGIFGSAIVALVAAEHESRVGQMSMERAFYGVQAGLEYAIREINQGGHPEVTDKSFGYGTFTVDVNYGGGNRQIIATGKVGTAQKTHQITYNSFGADCLGVNNDTATLTGPGKTDLKAITLKRNCNDAITIDKIRISWDPESGERVTKIKIKNDLVWEDPFGVPSDTTIDIADVVLTGSVAHQVNLIEFTSGMLGKALTTTYIMSDTSIHSETFTILPPK